MFRLFNFQIKQEGETIESGRRHPKPCCFWSPWEEWRYTIADRPRYSSWRNVLPNQTQQWGILKLGFWGWVCHSLLNDLRQSCHHDKSWFFLDMCFYLTLLLICDRKALTWSDLLLCSIYSGSHEMCFVVYVCYVSNHILQGCFTGNWGNQLITTIQMKYIWSIWVKFGQYRTTTDTNKSASCAHFLVCSVYDLMVMFFMVTSTLLPMGIPSS